MEAVSPATVRSYARVLRLSQTRPGLPAPSEPEPWLQLLFPHYVSAPFGERHHELWEWFRALELDTDPDPFVAVWPRGGAKTTTVELGCAYAGVRGCRRYAWYVNETQDKADLNVQNIATLLESRSIERHYPAHSERMVGKFGDSRGWRRNRLRTAGGFTVDALGLDTASRGLKIEEQRPDLIILDDVDGKHDSPATTAKKIATITTSILPAGSPNVAVVAVQNLIIPNGFFSRLSDGRADFMVHRTVSGPHPAVDDLEYEQEQLPSGIKRARITAGTATWAGQPLEKCQSLMDKIGLTAFLKECQQLVKELAQGLAITGYVPEVHDIDWTDEEIYNAVGRGELRAFAGIDFGAWRFTFTLYAADEEGDIHILDEYFSQRENLATRAQKIHEMCVGYGIKPKGFMVAGDNANPTDITEINEAFRRGWLKDGKQVKSKYVVHPVAAANKARVTSVERIADLFAAVRLRVRSTLGEDMAWSLGMNASSDGTPMAGSRLKWEWQHWSYPDPLEGRAQKQDPDDDTADGGDSIASMRYAIMTHLYPAKPAETDERPLRNYDRSFTHLVKALEKAQRPNKGRGF